MTLKEKCRTCGHFETGRCGWRIRYPRLRVCKGGDQWCPLGFIGIYWEYPLPRVRTRRFTCQTCKEENESYCLFDGNPLEVEVLYTYGACKCGDKAEMRGMIWGELRPSVLTVWDEHPIGQDVCRLSVTTPDSCVSVCRERQI